MTKYTISELVKRSNLSRREVLRHINGKILETEKTSAGYLIDDEKLQKWLDDIPNITDVEDKSIFNTEDSLDYNDLIEYVDIKENINKNQKKLYFADFFCGAGGLSEGFVEAGYEPVVYVDIFKSALDTYKKNIIDKNKFKLSQKHKTMDITNAEIKEEVINILKSNNVDVICGGFPCQGFSLSGTGVATDPRNTLYHDMLDIVKEVKPSVIVMENVTGILSMLKGKVVNKIVSDYSQIGYKLSWKVLNSADYEVPQMRKRVIFIGNKVNKNNYYPQIITKPENYKTVKETIGYLEKNPSDPKINHVISKHSDNMKERLLAVEIGKTLYPGYADSWKKLNPNAPAYTIKENHGAPNIHYSEPRVITAHEMALLQSFPSDYIFEGTKSEQLKQIGNAVPPKLAYALAEAIKKYFY